MAGPQQGWGEGEAVAGPAETFRNEGMGMRLERFGKKMSVVKVTRGV